MYIEVKNKKKRFSQKRMQKKKAPSSTFDKPRSIFQHS